MTDFDVTSYPLTTETQFDPQLGTRTDRLKSGEVRIRQVSTTMPANLTCVFSPQTETESAAFWQYLKTNKLTELDITHNGDIYRGYINGESVKKRIAGGLLHAWTFTLEGVIV